MLLRPWSFGVLIATLPWLHQKFLPLWAVLAATALVLVVWRLRHVGAGSGQGGGPLGPLLAIATPQALTLFLTALYNFAITGSVRPDALFLAWGPGGVTSARVGQGLLGLLLDARYGILPYVPFLALGVAGLFDRRARPLVICLPGAVAYYLTVASADNWAGAVCNLGRYFMPVAPLAVLLVGLALLGRERGGLTRGGLALALMLAAWTAVFASALWRDPHAANDSALLLAKGVYADGHQYVPDLFIRRWSSAAPGLWARIVAWVVALALVAWGMRRAVSPLRVLLGAAVVVLGLALVLERWPGRRTAPAFANALPAESGALVFLDGAARLRGDEARLGPGRVEIVRRVSAGTALGEPTPLRVLVGGTGLLRVPGLAPLVLRPGGARVDLPLLAYHVVRGADGRTATFTRTSATIDGQAVLRLGDEAAAVGEQVEPDGPGLR